MAQTVVILDALGTNTFSPPGVPFTFDAIGAIGGGGGANAQSGGGGACVVNLAQSVITGDIEYQNGAGGADGYTPGGRAIWDTSYGANYLAAPGGYCETDGGAGGAGGAGTYTITHNGGTGVGVCGGGAGGANADGGNGTVVGGSGGSGALTGLPAAMQVALTGGNGGSVGADGDSPGGGGGSGHGGGQSRIVVAYTLVAPSISGDTGSGSTTTFNVDYATQDPQNLATITTVGNPTPTLSITGGAQGNLFQLNFDDPVSGPWFLQPINTNELLSIGSYVIELTASSGVGADFVQTATMNVRVSSGFNPNSVSGNCSLTCGLSIEDTPPQIFQTQLESPYGIV